MCAFSVPTTIRRHAPTVAMRNAICNVRAVAIDLDGTLLDTIPDLCGAVNLVLADLNFSPLPIDLVKTFVGKGLGEQLMQNLIGCAQQAGYAEMEGTVLLANQAMLALATKLGFSTRSSNESRETARLRLILTNG